MVNLIFPSAACQAQLECSWQCSLQGWAGKEGVLRAHGLSVHSEAGSVEGMPRASQPDEACPGFDKRGFFHTQVHNLAKARRQAHALPKSVLAVVEVILLGQVAACLLGPQDPGEHSAMWT